MAAGTEPPGRSCDNPQCAQRYHDACLQSWLQSLPDAHVAFNMMVGPCPYCSHGLSVPTLALGALR